MTARGDPDHGRRNPDGGRVGIRMTARGRSQRRTGLIETTAMWVTND